MRTRAISFALTLVFSASVPHRLGAVALPNAQHLLASQVSELQFVHDSLRAAARRGDITAYRELYDPATLRETLPTANGHRRLSARWLRRHAREWPDIRQWEVADAQGYGEWARLTYRHPHIVSGAPDGRWDFYFLQYRQVNGHWHLSRRAIATFGAPGPLATAPRVDELPLVPLFALPPRPWPAVDAAS